MCLVVILIDKEASINEEIDIMRHSATQSLLHDDVIVVSSELYLWYWFT